MWYNVTRGGELAYKKTTSRDLTRSNDSMETQLSDWLTVSGAAKALNVKPSAMYMRMRRRNIPYDVVGRTILIRKSDLDLLLTQSERLNLLVQTVAAKRAGAGK